MLLLLDLCFCLLVLACSVPAASFVASSENASFHDTGMLHGLTNSGIMRQLLPAVRASKHFKILVCSDCDL